jgi:hypothetical protein
MAQRFRAHPTEAQLLEALDSAVSVAQALPFPVQYWMVQNIYFDIMKNVSAKARSQTTEAAADSEKWLAIFRSLGEKLSIRVE